jgi:hypothetical protein
MLSNRPHEIRTISCRWRIYCVGRRGTAVCPIIAGSPCIPVGHVTWPTLRNSPARDADGDFHFPGISPEAAEWLIRERQVIGLAVDTLSLDHGTSKDFKTHLLWLPTGRWGLENVANLDQLPASGATLVVGLAKVKGATGGPAPFAGAGLMTWR